LFKLKKLEIMENDNFFRELGGIEIVEFKQWARDNFKTGDVINSLWHPIVRKECEKMETETKVKSRDQVIDWLEKHTGFGQAHSQIQLTEDFNGNGGGVWLCGEGSEKYMGDVIFDYYSENYKDYNIGVLIPFEKKLDKMGWWCEWYDAGTIQIWKNL
jgi:hypothetical protein